MTLAEAWQSYATSVLPIDAPPVQVQETRRAFYAGAWAVWQAEKKIAALDISNDEAEKKMVDLENEILMFQSRVGVDM